MSESRKYAFLVGDGMGDYPIPELGGKTPLEAAATPNMDRIAACRIGRLKTIPDGMEPGSDVANLALLGYDPSVYHTGRAPLEAAGMGIEVGKSEVAFRMNLVTLDRVSDTETRMVSHSAGDISTRESGQLVEALRGTLKLPGVRMFPGVAYRHLLLWDGGPEDAETIPPHDVLDQDMTPYLNRMKDNPVPRLIRLSWEVLRNHPVNLERTRNGQKAANSIWLWGQGRPPNLPAFSERFGLSGGVISAVDLLKGIGVYAGLEPIEVQGATGYLDTNFKGKADAAVRALERMDFVFVHVEAPDEAGHSGNVDEKIQAIEAFDHQVVGRVMEGLEDLPDYRVLVVSDHLTPIAKRTHTTEPTLFAWADKQELESAPTGPGFTESSAEASGLFFEKGHTMIDTFLELGSGH